MSLASAFALSAALVVLFVACFHAWIHRQRRQEREHLWLAVTAGAIAAFGVTASLLYSARTVEEGVFWQRVMFATSCPLLVGFLRFSFAFLHVERPGVTGVALAYSASVMLLALGSDLLFTGQPVERHAWLFGLHWTESGLSPFGHAVMAGYFVAFAYLITLYARQRRGARDVRTLLLTLCLWCTAGLSDAAVAMELYEAPYSLAFGYLAIVLGFSSILVRRLVEARTELERLAARLEEEVERRSEDLRRKELQLARGEQLATIGTLAASVAHEINNPIAFVHSNLNRLDEMWDKDDEGGEEVAEILAECREGTERVKSIVSDLLRLARSGDVRTEPVDLHETIAKALPLARGTARRRARLVTRLAGVPRVRGDERLLGQVVLNLVMNALQAIPEGTPETNEVSVSTSVEEGRVRLVVADTGPGIPAELQERIFDPFYTTKHEGTGLGLAVTHDIVSRHRGSIHVESSPSGTRMIVELPPAE